jgi:hypothetical protein
VVIMMNKIEVYDGIKLIGIIDYDFLKGIGIEDAFIRANPTISIEEYMEMVPPEYREVK